MRNVQRWMLAAWLLGTTSVHARDCDVVAPPEAESVPPGWVADYDYQSDFTAFLAHQYRLAKENGQRPFVYFYADWCPPCREVRAVFVKHEPTRQAAAEMRIVMIEFDAFNCLWTRLTGKAVFPVSTIPRLVSVEADGSLGGWAHVGAWLGNTRGSFISRLKRFVARTDAAAPPPPN